MGSALGGFWLIWGGFGFSWVTCFVCLLSLDGLFLGFGCFLIRLALLFVFGRCLRCDLGCFLLVGRVVTLCVISDLFRLWLLRVLDWLEVDLLVFVGFGRFLGSYYLFRVCG